MIAFDKDRRLDLIGKPLYGRVSFYQKDTNQLDKIYVYDENDQLVLCENPVYTDINGFLEYDVILENKIYTVHQEKYIGDYDDPKTDNRPNMWADDRTYYTGLDISSGNQDSILFGYESIADADPSLGMITVVGYHTNDDCGARTYIWDENSNDQIDNGQVFGSQLQSGGRWLLVHSLPYIPSEYYGVYEGHLENMSALFGASNQYGTDNRILSPKVIKMKRGDYNIQTNYSTSRTLLLEDQVDFGSAHTVTCKNIQFAGARNSKPIGNFHFNGSYVEVDSLIFYDLFQMLISGAKTIHIYNKLSSQTSVKNANITCSNITFIGHGSIDYTNDSYSITFNGCHFIGENMLNVGTNFYLRNMVVSDRPFKDYFNNTGVEASTCTVNIENFEHPLNFVLTARHCGFTVIDLQGRTLPMNPNIALALLGEGITYRNGSLGYVSVNNTTAFEHCIIDKMWINGAVSVSLTNCKVGILKYENGNAVITLADSWVASMEHDKNVSCVMGAVSTVFNSSIGEGLTQGAVGDNTNPFKGDITLINCKVNGDIIIRGALDIQGTTVSGSVWTQDFLLNGTQDFIYSVMRNCVIGGRHLLQHYTPYRTGVKTTCFWIGNLFLNTEKIPIYPESWSDPLGEGKFTRNDCTTLYLDPYPAHHIWLYKSNTGPKVISEYPMGSFTSIINVADTHGVEGYATIQEVPYVAPGHSIKSVDGNEYETMDFEDLFMDDLKVNLRFYREMYWTGHHETRHRPDYIDNPTVVHAFATNKDYAFDGGYHWMCRPRKVTAFWENSSEAYFRIMFSIDSDNHDWGNIEAYGSLDVLPYYSVKYTG